MTFPVTKPEHPNLEGVLSPRRFSMRALSLVVFVLFFLGCGDATPTPSPVRVDVPSEAAEVFEGGDVASMDASPLDAAPEAAVDALAPDAVAMVDAVEESQAVDAVDVDAIDVDPRCTLPLMFCVAGCHDFTTSAANCGACGHACGIGEACVASACVRADAGTPDAMDAACRTDFANCDMDPTNGCETDTWTSVGHCGGCGRACAPDVPCIMGVCTPRVVSCGPGETRCGDACVDITNHLLNCGACGRRCGSGQECRVGVCTITCPIGLTFCGSTCRELSASPDNCGTCGNNCGGGAICISGRCVPCEPGWISCSNVCIDPMANPSHCGTCGRACPAPISGRPGCRGGVCVVGSCEEPLADCDGMLANGCETPIATRTNCGACGRACGDREACVGTSVATARCACASTTDLVCEGRCVRRDVPENCGRCGNTCTINEFCDALPGVCRSCGLSSEGNALVRCDDRCTDIFSSNDHCGACNNRCGSRICFSGICR